MVLLLCFLVKRVLAAELAVFVHFKSVGTVFLVFHCVVIALLAFSACKCDFNSHNGTSRFTEIFFAFTNSRRKPDTVKVNASLGFARIIVPVRNIMLWAKSTCTIYSQGIITGSFAKKKNLFRGIAIISHCSTKVKHFLCRKSAL